jgi:ferredoxin--NADP+ reductase
MSVKFAIVGSGPGGMYAADALVKSFPDCEIDVFDRMPAPFGLIRYGVAPDHYTTKNTARQFVRTMELDNVRFFGNVEIGSALSFAELKAAYDAVVIAVGAYNDRKLGIPGEDLPGVYGACAFVGWYNGHPDHRDLAPLLDRAGVAVIGLGNVAIDCCRVLAKTPGEMAETDLCRHAAEAIHAAPLESLHMFGRRGPIEATFTPKELRELGDLERCDVIADPAQLPDAVTGDFESRERGIKEKNLSILKDLAGRAPRGKDVTMRLQFYTSPVEILGTGRVEGLKLERNEVVGGRAVGTGETFEVEVGAVITAIGYYTRPLDGVPMNGTAVANRNGRVEENVYVVGWSKRGPTGTIPTNGPDSRAVADLIAEDLAAGGGRKGHSKGGRETVAALLGERGVRMIDFSDWHRIHNAEVARAEGKHPQEKFTRVEEMLALLDA